MANTGIFTNTNNPGGVVLTPPTIDQNGNPVPGTVTSGGATTTVAPGSPPVAATGMSTAEKLGLGLGIAAAVALVAYIVFNPSDSPDAPTPSGVPRKMRHKIHHRPRRVHRGR